MEYDDLKVKLIDRDQENSCLTSDNIKALDSEFQIISSKFIKSTNRKIEDLEKQEIDEKSRLLVFLDSIGDNLTRIKIGFEGIISLLNSTKFENNSYESNVELKNELASSQNEFSTYITYLERVLMKEKNAKNETKELVKTIKELNTKMANETLKHLSKVTSKDKKSKNSTFGNISIGFLLIGYIVMIYVYYMSFLKDILAYENGRDKI